ncbi:MFS transporter [Massilia sp. MS-15]|uniref:MFS transporter n=1 Tax=Massilia sp. MS-15 TaxID=2878200 RepID=UPI001CD22B1B|nr:MFS transporter [Massilia sp. MS-15]MCA1246381.1 MFS transporter [Massilia sp. MS-15]
MRRSLGALTIASPHMNDTRALRRDPNFNWLMSGSLISALGDQFTLIALPWLVLQLTGDPLALGMMVAAMGVPRAVLILFGGAVVDRHSPKRVLMLTKHANTGLLAILAALVLAGQASLPLVALLAIGLSLASAFSIPAGTSMLPHAVPARHLAAANGTMMAVRQLTLLAGPLLAGLLFALAGDGSAGMQDARGLGIAFALDALSYAVSAWTLSRVRPLAAATAGKAREPVLQAVGAALATVWRTLQLRTAFLYWGLCACVVGGLMQVALPLLASERLHGASALALLMGAHGAGTLAGMALSGALGKRRLVNLGVTLLVVDGVVGLLLLPIGLVTQSWQGMLLLAAIGVLGGFVQVAVFTWIQQAVPKPMLGRMMAIFMFVFMGLAPLAAAGAGWLASRLSLDLLFAAAGLFLAAAAVLAWLFTPMASLADAPLPQGQGMESDARIG